MLLEKIIEDACHPDDADHEEDKRAKTLKNQMVIIRGLSNAWDEMADLFVNGSEPYSVMIRDVLDVICESTSDLRVVDIVCICTYVTDVCTSLTLLNETFDGYTVDIDDIIKTAVNYMVDRDVKLCREFLFWLDYVYV